MMRRAPFAVASVVVAVAGPTHAQSAPSLDTALAGDAVYSASPARRVLYSWTSEAQLEELRRDPSRLLIRESSPTYGLGVFGRVTATQAEGGDAVARMLRHEGMTRVRYAWSNPWATTLAPSGGDYGDVLVQITLRETAWLLRYDSATLQWSAVDMENRPVAIADVLAHPARVAAVYFVNAPLPSRMPAAATASGPPEGHREYVIVNPSMVERWEADTPATFARIEAARRAMQAFQADPRTSQTLVNLAAPATEPAHGSPLERYIAGLAFPTLAYQPTNVNAVVERLTRALARSSGARGLQGHPSLGFHLGAYRAPAPQHLAPPASFST